jgi:16S rRNA (uracil1498-N3)-methyltransferase
VPSGDPDLEVGAREGILASLASPCRPFYGSAMQRTIEPTGSGPSVSASFRPKLRLFADLPLAAGTALESSPGQSHYLLTVMRLGEGDPVALFNGQDGEWLGMIEAVQRRRCRVAVLECLRPQQPEPGPALLFAPLKRSRLELLVEKATELGVGSLQPVICRRSVVDRVNRTRLQSVAIEAAEQCGRLTLPDLAWPLELSECLASRAPGERLYFGDETGGGLPILDALGRFGRGDLLIGPEGGFAPEELADLQEQADAVGLSLGSRILRAETAAIAALACWQAAFGAGQDAA